MALHGSASCVDEKQVPLSLCSSDGTASTVPSESGTKPSGKRKKNPKRYRLKKTVGTSDVERLVTLLGFSLEDFEEVKARKAKPPDAPKEPANAAFFMFWKLYPRRDIIGAAMKAWKDLQPDSDTVELIVRDVQRRGQSFEWQKDGGKYIPYAHTYLNGKRWLDEGVVGHHASRKGVVV